MLMPTSMKEGERAEFKLCRASVVEANTISAKMVTRRTFGDNGVQ